MTLKLYSTELYQPYRSSRVPLALQILSLYLPNGLVFLCLCFYTEYWSLHTKLIKSNKNGLPSPKMESILNRSLESILSQDSNSNLSFGFRSNYGFDSDFLNGLLTNAASLHSHFANFSNVQNNNSTI